MDNSNTTKTPWLVYILLAGLALLAGFLLSTQMFPQKDDQKLQLTLENGGKAAMAKKGSKRPDFSLPDLEGTQHAISEWDGKVVLVNFWATWCPPCREEMPAFISLKETYGEQGFEIIGVAIDELGAIADFADTLGVNYPVLHGQADASAVTRQYGNKIGALPYSVLLDRDGIVRFTRAGGLSKRKLESELKKYL